MKITKAQRRLLLDAKSRGGIAMGGFGTAQHHRPAWKLTEMGLVRFCWIPLPSDSFTAQFLGATSVGLRCQGWTISKAGRRYAAMLTA